MCKSKELEGLGIGNILNRNRALVMKWLWRFPTGSNSLWVKVVKSIYGMNENGWDSKEASRATYKSPWKYIVGCLSEFWKLIEIKVGKGVKLRFWEDIWIGDSSLEQRFQSLYRIARSHNMVIPEIRRNETYITEGYYSWDFKFIRNLNEREMGQSSDMIILLDSARFCEVVQDKRIWSSESIGLFSSKSCFKTLCTDERSTPFQHYNFIWKSKTPFKSQGLLLDLSPGESKHS